VEAKTQKKKIKLEKPGGFQIDPQMKALSKRFGIPLDKIIDYTQKQDTRLANVEKAIIEIAKHIESSDEKLAPIVSALEQAQTAQTQATANSNPAPQGMPCGMGALMQLLPSLLGGGGGDSEMTKRLMEMSIKRMEADIGFSDAIKQAIVTKIAGRAASDIV